MRKLIISLVLLFAVLICKSQDTSKKVTIADFPKEDLPPAGFNFKGLKYQSSENYYYGFGVPKNYVTARYLAFKEMEEDTASYAGSDILLMVYANGYGVKRNLDLCIWIARKNIWSAEAEVEGRVAHLKDMKAGNDTKEFNICDDITSGYMMGICGGLQFSADQCGRDSILNPILAGWPKKDTIAYKVLRNAADSFFIARVDNEVDLSGTARSMFEYMEQDSLEYMFLYKIKKLNTCDFKHYSTQDFIKADSELNAVYKKIMATKATDSEWGTVTQDGIRTTQRSWLPYRDAWVSFGQLMCPSLSANTWKTLLTLERITELQEFVIE